MKTESIFMCPCKYEVGWYRLAFMYGITGRGSLVSIIGCSDAAGPQLAWVGGLIGSHRTCLEREGEKGIHKAMKTNG